MRLIILAAFLLAKPAPTDFSKDKALKLQGKTNWGVLTQKNARDFTIEGHESWEAVGVIRKDGKVQLTWFQGDRPALAVYSVMEDGSFVGFWGYEGQCEILGNGELVGNVSSETIRREE